MTYFRFVCFNMGTFIRPRRVTTSAIIGLAPSRNLIRDLSRLKKVPIAFGSRTDLTPRVSKRALDWETAVQKGPALFCKLDVGADDAPQSKWTDIESLTYWDGEKMTTTWNPSLSGGAYYDRVYNVPNGIIVADGTLSPQSAAGKEGFPTWVPVGQ
ncbi:uncharacterized protein PAC_17377 [Phialocephala subalpina]|uniref:Uncharacterized protein n=1 Tax=Phialocephala subalpina TaxID=576137 RepID=A0A1L7XR98_9HELO|nr:uncharacterized protein PAC_17377 [Phialocephala subalpina]